MDEAFEKYLNDSCGWMAPEQQERYRLILYPCWQAATEHQEAQLKTAVEALERIEQWEHHENAKKLSAGAICHTIARTALAKIKGK